MFWVVTEICSEPNLVKRSKIIKQFIKLARKLTAFLFICNFFKIGDNFYIHLFCIFAGHCKECKNFNSLFAVISGLGHISVNRLRQTWEKLPTKYGKLFSDLQELMDPSRNMSKYRQLVASVQTTPPMVKN